MFRKLAVILILCTFLTGCATWDALKERWQSMDPGEKYTLVVSYGGKFLSGLSATASVVAVFCSDCREVINETVKPSIAAAQGALSRLDVAVQAYKAGTLTEAQLTLLANEVWALIEIANGQVGEVKARAGMSANPSVATMVTR